VTNILLGSDFMFNEELGSRLLGIGYSVQTFNNRDELESKLVNDISLVIIDLERKDLGGLESLQFIIENKIPAIALTQHRSTNLGEAALEIGARKVIFNSQAANDIESYVSEILKNE